MYVIVIDINDIYKLKNFYEPFLVETNNPYMNFKAEIGNVVVECYNSGKVVYRGDNVKGLIDKLEIPFEITTDPQKSNLTTTSSIGSDEVGTGDLFGPIVICSFYLDEKDSDKFISMGIADSKKISDDKIRKLGKELMPYTYNAVIINNRRYNELTNDGYNMNELKAIAHNKAILHTVNDVKKKAPVILDEFCSEDLYYKYLRGSNMIYDEIIFTTKAESKYLAVACASVMARYIFLLEMDKMEKKLNMKIPKGAGAEADKLIEKLDIDLTDYAKLNFKNFNKKS